jgi:Bifunctional DNA primase/polymerase, N-terminal/Primase C terminal 2 (PriCT-2)
MIEGLPTFPCNAAKEPLIARGFRSARLGANHARWPLVGFPTGAASGVDVLDIDPRGRGWFDENFDAIPATRAHQTQRGVHLLFKHAAGLRCSTSRIAPGVDVRADGGYSIWWPREGLPVEDRPVCEWPNWLLREAMGKPHASVSGSIPSLPPSDVTALRDALFRLDPVEWGGDGRKESYEKWLTLMIACKAVGISKEDWIAWCIGDECYAGDAAEIGRKWDGVLARHGGALWEALAARGIKWKAGTDIKMKMLRFHLVLIEWWQSSTSAPTAVA